MQSIADATTARRSRERWQLVIGTVLLLAGAVFVAIGAAGLVRSHSLKTGVALGGVAILVGMVVLVAHTPLGERERTTAAVGVAIGLAGTSLFWIVAPADVVSGSLAESAFAALGFLAGAVLVIAAVLAAAALRSTDGTPAQSSGDGWTRVEAKQDVPRQSADGGYEDEKLSFPLDDE